MRENPVSNRRQAIDTLRRQLQRDGWPRLQMLLLVTITGGAGFVASWALLQRGMHEMWLRYPLALGVAYLCFLFLLWLWLRTRFSDWLDTLDVADVPDVGSAPGWHGDGGGSGGGGASASFDSTHDGAIDAITGPIGDAVGDAVGTAAEADELAIPLAGVILAVTLVAVVVFSSLFVVWSAPVLFAELLVDGALAAGLYRRLRRIESRHWLETAIRRTWLPFLLTALFAAAVGWGMSRYAPEADSIGDVVAQQAQD